MFRTNGKPEPELAYAEATARPPNASIWLDETGGCLVVSTRSAVGSITAKTRELLRGGRDPRVDTLRGLFLVVMMIDHLPFHPLRRFSSQSLGFVSSAEGFVFVSGLVSAWVYGRILLRKGEEALWRRAWHRARDIYFTHLLLYTLALLGGLWGGWQIADKFAGFWEAWWRGAVLIYQPPLFGILPMYSVFLLLTPVLLQQMARGRALLICAISIALWLPAQFGLGSLMRNPSSVQFGSLNILAWQLLFVAGAYFGYQKIARGGSPIPASRVLLVLSVIVVTVLFFVRHQILFFGNLSLADTHTAIREWRSINHPLRLLNFAAFAYIIWSIPRSVDEKVHEWSVFRFLRYLGGHSLQVFAWSILVSYAAFSFSDSWAALSPAWRMLLAVAAMVSLVLPAWVHERWNFLVLHKAGRALGNTALQSEAGQ